MTSDWRSRGRPLIEAKNRPSISECSDNCSKPNPLLDSNELPSRRRASHRDGWWAGCVGRFDGGSCSLLCGPKLCCLRQAGPVGLDRSDHRADHPYPWWYPLDVHRSCTAPGAFILSGRRTVSGAVSRLYHRNPSLAKYFPDIQREAQGHAGWRNCCDCLGHDILGFVDSSDDCF